MKHAKKMILRPMSITSDPVKKLILDFEKEINEIFEKRELTAEERINLYYKTLNKYESLHSNNLNNNKEDENMDGFDKNRENGDKEIYYELQDPNRLGQDNASSTDNYNGENSTNHTVASITHVENVPSETTIPLAPSRILRERNDNEENYDDHYNNYLFPTKKIKINNNQNSEQENNQIQLNNINEMNRPQILSSIYYDDMSIQGDDEEQEEEEEMELEEQRGIKRKSYNTDVSNIKRFRESIPNLKRSSNDSNENGLGKRPRVNKLPFQNIENTQYGVKRKGNDSDYFIKKFSNENNPSYKRFNDGEELDVRKRQKKFDDQFTPMNRRLKRKTEFDFGEKKRSREDYRGLKRLNDSEEYDFRKKRKMNEISSEEEEEHQQQESIYNKKKKKYQSVLNDKARILKRKLVFDENEEEEGPFEKKTKIVESESDDENRVGLDILPIKNQRLYGTEEDEIINLKRKRSGLDSLPNKRQRIYENQHTILKLKRSGIDFVPYKKQRVDDLKWIPYKLSNIN